MDLLGWWTPHTQLVGHMPGTAGQQDGGEVPRNKQRIFPPAAHSHLHRHRSATTTRQGEADHLKRAKGALSPADQVLELKRRSFLRAVSTTSSGDHRPGNVRLLNGVSISNRQGAISIALSPASLVRCLFLSAPASLLSKRRVGSRPDKFTVRHAISWRTFIHVRALTKVHGTGSRPVAQQHAALKDELEELNESEWDQIFDHEHPEVVMRGKLWRKFTGLAVSWEEREVRDHRSHHSPLLSPPIPSYLCQGYSKWSGFSKRTETNERNQLVSF